MDKVELPSCPVCQLEYDEVVPLVLTCGHSVCRECVKKLTNHNGKEQKRILCPVCRQRSALINMAKNFELEEAIGVIKKLNKEPEPIKDSLQCTSCEYMECEYNLFVCRNCVQLSLHYDIMNVVAKQTPSELEPFVICGSCAIRFHVSAGHETHPYFSITTKFQFENHLKDVSIQRKRLEEKVAAAEEHLNEYKQNVRRTYEELDKMTEMMRTSRSSEDQREFAKRISEECSKTEAYVTSVTSFISTGNHNYQIEFDKLVATNLQDEMEMCEEILKLTPEFMCTSCCSIQPEESMMCCRKCSKTVELLMSDKIDASNFDTVDKSALPICMQCLFKNHSPGNHSFVTFSNVLDKYQVADKVTRLSKKEAETREKFVVLVKKSQQYISLLQSYNQMIKKLSRISVASRGLPEHDTDLARLDQCLKDAEPIMNSLQTSADFDSSLPETPVEREIEKRLTSYPFGPYLLIPMFIFCRFLYSHCTA